MERSRADVGCPVAGMFVADLEVLTSVSSASIRGAGATRTSNSTNLPNAVCFINGRRRATSSVTVIKVPSHSVRRDKGPVSENCLCTLANDFLDDHVVVVVADIDDVLVSASRRISDPSVAAAGQR